MIKTLIAANRSEREKFNVPRSVQQSIPIRRIYKDGIWQVGEKYSRTWRFTDINYAVAGEDDQRIMFQSYSGVLNSLPYINAAAYQLAVWSAGLTLPAPQPKGI